jgi:hypothetical protein
MDTLPRPNIPATASHEMAIGFLLGLLIGEGHFGGDGRQPQLTLRMHVRHEKVFRWLEATFPGGKLYGPYTHGGRHYYQWMARGEYLRRVLAPLIAGHRDWLDDHAGARFDAMCERYRIGEAGGGRGAEAVLQNGEGWSGNEGRAGG